MDSAKLEVLEEAAERVRFTVEYKSADFPVGLPREAYEVSEQEVALELELAAGTGQFQNVCKYEIGPGSKERTEAKKDSVHGSPPVKNGKAHCQ